MREILFRGKRIDNGEWAYGYYVFCGEDHYILPVCDESFQGESVGEYIKYGFDDRYSDWIKIIPESVCQSTGLISMNGNRVFDNDIITITHYNYHEPENSYYGIVEYSKNHRGWCIKCFNISKEKPLIPLCKRKDVYTTIIDIHGNIFDNKELLEEQT